MNKAVLDQMWDQFRQKYGVYLRLLEAFPADKLATHPVAGMRTPAELVAHVCGTIVRDIPEGVAKGRITAEESEETKAAGELSDTATLLAFARRCWEQGDAAVQRVGDAELGAMVGTPWGSSWPGAVAFHVMSDEFMHHQGQLYAMARACGVAPPFLWSYGENAPEFQPREAAAAGA
ncbi:MAG TPA: DinB family protein [Gemmatimonadales bacterium]|jgi:uncharacterized damage-inducible protein DinB